MLKPNDFSLNKTYDGSKEREILQEKRRNPHKINMHLQADQRKNELAFNARSDQCTSDR
ncbi:hypothetical protein ACIQW9_04605 [Herminiimonas sp. NPDC097707]|uniref:hypothetical protein n=1 Tax=Herminiimonas sp. NPDC097707 TaxID=3364007 RepID=UPI00383B4D6B